MKATIRTKHSGTFCDVEVVSIMTHVISFDVNKQQTTIEQIKLVHEQDEASVTDYKDKLHICIPKKKTEEIIINEL